MQIIGSIKLTFLEGKFKGESLGVGGYIYDDLGITRHGGPFGGNHSNE